MNRKAIIIEASTIKGCTDLPGARADAANYSRWLRTLRGGAWEQKDIAVLSHPTATQLEAALANAAKADYAFIAFSGHGEHVVGKLVNDTLIQINDTQDYSARKMASGFKRGVIVVDSCRNLRVVKAIRESYKYARAKTFSDDATLIRRHQSLFNKGVTDAEEGVVYLFGCSVNQSANDFPNGGVFSFALLDEAESWGSFADPPSTLNLNDAFNKAKAVVEREVTNQKPEMNGAIRRKVHFPFGVSA